MRTFSLLIKCNNGQRKAEIAHAKCVKKATSQLHAKMYLLAHRVGKGEFRDNRSMI